MSIFPIFKAIIVVFLAGTYDARKLRIRQKDSEKKDFDVVRGEFLQARCSLDKAYAIEEHLNATDLGFKFEWNTSKSDNPDDDYDSTDDETDFNTILVEPNDIHIKNLFTAFLETRITSDFPDKMLFTCFLKSNNSIKDDAEVLIGDLPAMPEMKDCIVENWSILTCNWMINNTGMFETNYSAKFRSSSNWKNSTTCHTRDNTSSCSLPDPYEKSAEDRLLFVKLIGKNMLGRTPSREFTINLTNITVPDAVDKLSHQLFVNNSVEFSFNSSKPEKDLACELNVTCRGKTYMKMMLPNVGTTNIVMSMDDLPAYSHCAAVVRCKPRGYGQWSRTSDLISFEMFQLVPMSAPEITGFSVKSCNHRQCNIFLYIKELPIEKARGEILEFRIIVEFTNGTSRRLDFAPTARIILEGLPQDSDFNITLNAATVIGYNETLEPSFLHVSSSLLKNTGWVEHKNFTAFALNDSTVELRWSCTVQICHDTVYWCYGRLNGKLCENEVLSSKTVPNSTQYILPPGIDSESYNFGISSDFGDGLSTAIHWANCIYYVNGYAPGLPELSLEDKNESALVFRIKKPPCLYKSTFTYGFNASYCPIQNGVCSDLERRSKFIKESDSLVTLEGLQPSQNYAISIVSVSQSGNSPPKQINEVTNAASTIPKIPVLWYGIGGIGAVFVLVILGLGIFSLKRYIIKFHDWWSLPIKLPQEKEHLQNGVTSGNSYVDVDRSFPANLERPSTSIEMDHEPLLGSNEMKGMKVQDTELNTSDNDSNLSSYVKGRNREPGFPDSCHTPDLLRDVGDGSRNGNVDLASLSSMPEYSISRPTDSIIPNDLGSDHHESLSNEDEEIESGSSDMSSGYCHGKTRSGTRPDIQRPPSDKKAFEFEKLDLIVAQSEVETDDGQRWNDHGSGESSDDGSASGSNLSIYVKGCNREVEGYAEGGVEGEAEREAEGDVQEDAGATARKLPTSNAPNQNGNVTSLALLPEFINSCSSEANKGNFEHSTTVQDHPKPSGMLIGGDDGADTRLLDGGQIAEDDDSYMNSGNTNSDCLSSYSRPRVMDLGNQDKISDVEDSTESCSEEEDDYSKAQGRTKQTKINLDLNKLSQPAAEIDEMMAFAKK